MQMFSSLFLRDHLNIPRKIPPLGYFKKLEGVTAANEISVLSKS